MWSVTPVVPGTHTVRYRIAAGLNGKAHARLAGGGEPQGSFTVRISSQASAHDRRPRHRRGGPRGLGQLALRTADATRAGVLVFGAYYLVLGLWQAIAPGPFYDAIGPFGPRNDHYTRDAATWSLALGVALLLADRRPSWRVPVLALATLQSALHAINHLRTSATPIRAGRGPSTSSRWSR